MTHLTPRTQSSDPAAFLLRDNFKSQPKVYRASCYICIDMEFARMGLPLCSPCCVCRKKGIDGHIPADEGKCDDCGHDMCESCFDEPASTQEICTCNTPCCEVDVGVGIITCESYHCPTHGINNEQNNNS